MLFDIDELRRLIFSSSMTDVKFEIDRILVRHVFDKSGKAYLTDVLDYRVKYDNKIALRLVNDEVLVKRASNVVPEEQKRLLNLALQSLPLSFESAGTSCSDLDVDIVSGVTKIPKITNFEHSLKFNEKLINYEFELGQEN